MILIIVPVPATNGERSMLTSEETMKLTSTGCNRSLAPAGETFFCRGKAGRCRRADGSAEGRRNGEDVEDRDPVIGAYGGGGGVNVVGARAAAEEEA